MVWLAAVIAPATGGARWLTSTMMVLRQALLRLAFRNLCISVPAIFERLGSTQIQADGCMRKRTVRAPPDPYAIVQVLPG